MRSTRSSRLLLLMLAAACGSPVAPVLCDVAERVETPAVYQLWWEMTLQCTGRRAPLSTVRWYFVPGARTVQVNGERYAGYWSSAGNSIVLAEEAMLDGPLVRHEMLHSLVEVGNHPRGEFLGRCAGEVEGDERGVTDAGPLQPVDPAVRRVGPASLEH